MDEQRIAKLEARVKRLDRLVYRLFQRLAALGQEAEAKPASEPDLDDIPF